MSDGELTPRQANDGIRPPAKQSPGWTEGLIRHAPRLTKLWGSYRAFVALIVLAALLTLPFLKDGGVIAFTIVVLAAMWSPLIAKKFGILD
jgi:hypothetical protein